MPRTDLPTTQLGDTGLDLTRVGLGTGSLGGPGRDGEDAVGTIRFAVEHGITWVDTSPGYGSGHQERVVRTALEPFGADERPYVFTGSGPSLATPGPARPADTVRREVDASLSRLGVERLDLYRLGRLPAGTPIEEYWAALLDLRRAGKVRAVGLSDADAARLTRARALGPVGAVRPSFSAIDRDAAGRGPREGGELAWCRTHDVGVLVHSPLRSGLLAGHLDRDRTAALSTDDRRHGAADFVGATLDRNLDLAGRLAYLAHRRDVALPAYAVGWALSWPGVTAAVVGARRPDQVAGWLPAAELTLTADDLDDVAEAIERSGAGTGPTRP